MKIWDQAWIKLTTPGFAVRYVIDCAMQPGIAQQLGARSGERHVCNNYCESTENLISDRMSGMMRDIGWQSLNYWRNEKKKLTLLLIDPKPQVSINKNFQCEIVNIF